MTVLSKDAGLSPWGKAVAGSVAAMLANALVYPLDLVKTKLQVQAEANLDNDEDYYNGTFDALSKIYYKHGISGLYAGLPGNLIGVMSTNFAYFYWYGLVRDSYIRRISSTGTTQRGLSTATELILGAIAGALAQLFTIPISVVTTRQQTDKDNKGLKDTFAQVVYEDGVTGLWKGLKASLVLVVNPSITYGSYERLKSALYPNNTTLSSQQNFLLGALSKSMATVATQPMIVAKVMQQSSNKNNKVQFTSFIAALKYLFAHEGLFGLWKGLGPQISKGVLVQGFLFAFKDNIELFMLLLYRLMLKKRRQLLLA